MSVRERGLCRLALATVVLTATGMVVAGAAAGALFFVFKPTSAAVGDRVFIRTPWTPAGFTRAQARRPLAQPISLYLVRNAIASSVRSRHDPRLVSIGRIRLDRDGRGTRSFTVPRVAPAVYTIAYWCRQCAPTSGGRAFTSFTVGPRTVAPSYRPLMVLRIRSS